MRLNQPTTVTVKNIPDTEEAKVTTNSSINVEIVDFDKVLYHYVYVLIQFKRIVPAQDVPFALILWYIAKTIQLS